MVVVAGFTFTATPLVTEPMPGVIAPVPPVNTAVKVVPFPPAVIVEASDVKLLIVGAAAFTVTVAVCVIAVPAAGVTVSV